MSAITPLAGVRASPQTDSLAKAAPPPAVLPVDLSVPDNSDYKVGRSKFSWALWYFFGAPIVKSYFLPFSRLKVIILRLFGAQIGSGVYMKPGVKVKFPWRLKVGDYSWIGEDVWIDNMAQVTIGSNACVSQGSYICTGNHNWSSHNMKLFTRPVAIEDGAWVAAHSTVCPGVTIGECAILTFSSVAGKSIPPFQIWSGSPAVYQRDRNFHQSNAIKPAMSDDEIHLLIN
jgi:putative colanic acid biosynthesis acetyltransferase WcaF